MNTYESGAAGQGHSVVAQLELGEEPAGEDQREDADGDECCSDSSQAGGTPQGRYWAGPFGVSESLNPAEPAWCSCAGRVPLPGGEAVDREEKVRRDDRAEAVDPAADRRRDRGAADRGLPARRARARRRPRLPRRGRRSSGSPFASARGARSRPRERERRPPPPADRAQPGARRSRGGREDRRGLPRRSGRERRRRPRPGTGPQAACSTAGRRTSGRPATRRSASWSSASHRSARPTSPPRPRSATRTSCRRSRTGCGSSRRMR